MSFSLRRTIKALLKEATDAADITCIYGIRALTTMVLYVAHQLITISRIPYSNRTSLTEVRSLDKIVRLCIKMPRYITLLIKRCSNRPPTFQPALFCEYH